MSPNLNSLATLRRARETLQTALVGLNDLHHDPKRRVAALSNVVVFGRAVTNVLENLRSSEPGFDEWYEPVSRALAADPLMKFFYGLRSRILKRGETGTNNYTCVKRLSPVDIKRFPEPANARRFFIGDSLGGSGWVVEVSPGIVEHYYVDLPEEIGTAGLFFEDAPVASGAGGRHGADVVVLCEHYLIRMQGVLNDANGKFGPAF